MPFTKEELDELGRAKGLLENPGLAAKLANYVGSPVEKGMKMLPRRWQAGVHGATEKALMKALDVAVKSLGGRSAAGGGRNASNQAHKIAVATSGAVGGAFGLPSAIDLLPSGQRRHLVADGIRAGSLWFIFYSTNSTLIGCGI